MEAVVPGVQTPQPRVQQQRAPAGLATAPPSPQPCHCAGLLPALPHHPRRTAAAGWPQVLVVWGSGGRGGRSGDIERSKAGAIGRGVHTQGLGEGVGEEVPQEQGLNLAWPQPIAMETASTGEAGG